MEDQASSTKHRAILLSVSAFLFFSLSDGARKYLAVDHSILDILSWQALIGIGVLLALSPWLGGVRSLYQSGVVKWHLLRGVLMAMNTTLSLLALSLLPMVDVYTIYFTTPFVICLLSVLFFKETIGPMRIVAIAVGFFGALVAFRPGFEVLSPAYLFACAAVFTFSFSNLIAKKAGSAKNTLSYGIYPLAFLLLFCLVQNGGHIPLPDDAKFYVISLFSGITYATALVGISLSFTMAPSAVVVPYQYTQIVWASLIGYFVFGDMPDGMRILGAIIIISSGVFFFMRERKHKGV